MCGPAWKSVADLSHHLEYAQQCRTSRLPRRPALASRTLFALRAETTPCCSSPRHRHRLYNFPLAPDFVHSTSHATLTDLLCVESPSGQRLTGEMPHSAGRACNSDVSPCARTLQILDLSERCSNLTSPVPVDCSEDDPQNYDLATVRSGLPGLQPSISNVLLARRNAALASNSSHCYTGLSGEGTHHVRRVCETSTYKVMKVSRRVSFVLLSVFTLFTLRSSCLYPFCFSLLCLVHRVHSLKPLRVVELGSFF